MVLRSSFSHSLLSRVFVWSNANVAGFPPRKAQTEGLVGCFHPLPMGHWWVILMTKPKFNVEDCADSRQSEEDVDVLIPSPVPLHDIDRKDAAYKECPYKWTLLQLHNALSCNITASLLDIRSVALVGGLRNHRLASFNLRSLALAPYQNLALAFEGPLLVHENQSIFWGFERRAWDLEGCRIDWGQALCAFCFRAWSLYSYTLQGK